MIPVDPRSVAYWPFDEHYSSQRPAELVAGISLAGSARPEVVDGTITGFGREFTRPLHGYIVWDTGTMRLTRALTVLALMRLDVESLENGNACVIVQRGHGGAGNERSYRLALEIVNVATRQVRLRLEWQTEAGVDVVDPGVLFVWPLGEYLLVAATREIVGGLFAVRYQINGESVLGGQAHALNCGGPTSGWFTLGYGLTSVSGTAEHRLDGVMASVQVLDDAVSADEFEWLWRRLSRAQPEGVATVRALVPPGVYSTDPESAVQRELAVEGSALGMTKALAERLRYYALPDRAWGSALERWERVTAHTPQPGDDYDTRRSRVLAFLGVVRGFAEQDVAAELAERFDLDAADVGLLEYGNDLSQAFASDPANGLAVAGNGSLTFTAGELAIAGSAADLRYGGMAAPNAPHYLWPLAAGDDSWVRLKIRSVAATTAGCLAGLMIGRREIDEWLFVGLVQTASTPANSIGWMRYRAGVLDAAITTLATANISPLYLWVHHVSGGTFEVRFGASPDAAQDAGPIELVTGHASPLWVGAVVVAPSGLSSVSPSVAVDDLFVHAPNGSQRFNWYAYRNPALPGTPDMFGARLVVDRIKPAHTFASATTVTALVCDDGGNGCEQAPIGR